MRIRNNMADIELVVKIPEEAYKLLKNEGVDWRVAEHILNAVVNGIPLPKGHGKLDSWYAPTVEAIPKDQINKAIEKIEQYICDVETDTVKAQGMAQALDMFEQALGEDEDGKD